jgi:hypothetical protein
VERLHNFTGNQPGLITRLELLIKKSQIFFSFSAAGFSSMGKIATVERLHNSTGNRPGVITRLELLIKESQIFFSFSAAGLSSMGKIARLSTLMVGTQQVVGKI